MRTGGRLAEPECASPIANLNKLALHYDDTIASNEVRTSRITEARSVR
jgi:hypothetical protein